jgi:inosose dehydratase
MSIRIACAPSCWGVDDPKNPYLPSWKKVLAEAGQSGFKGIELGPYGYIPLDVELVRAELEKNGLTIIVGTIFDDLVSAANRENLLRQTRDICSFITKLPAMCRNPDSAIRHPI